MVAGAVRLDYLELQSLLHYSSAVLSCGAELCSGLCAGLSIVGFGVQIPTSTNIWFEISALRVPLTNLDKMSSLTTHCR